VSRQDDPKWRTWGPTYWASVFTISNGIFNVIASAKALGRILWATKVLDTSIRQVTTTQEQASIRLEKLTQRLITWTKCLVVVSVILLLVTVVLVFATIRPRG
jgi:hypothetical protein